MKDKVIEILVIFLGIIAVLSIGPFVIMLIWNFLAGVFGFQTIGFLTAVVISIAGTIIGGFFKTSK